MTNIRTDYSFIVRVLANKDTFIRKRTGAFDIYTLQSNRTKTAVGWVMCRRSGEADKSWSEDRVPESVMRAPIS